MAVVQNPLVCLVAMNTRDNPLISLFFNVVIPFLILTKLSDDSRLGVLYAFLLSLAFPLCYGGYEFIKTRKIGFIPGLGFVSVMLSGPLFLLKVDGIWFAVKEALIPLLIGGAIMVSLKTRSPLIKSLFFNENFIDIDAINARLQERDNEQKFARLLTTTTYLLGISFLLSATLNFILAVVILQSPVGSVEFNQEFGKMTALSFPVIVLPCMVVTAVAIYLLLRGIKNLTGLSMEKFLHPKKTGKE